MRPQPKADASLGVVLAAYEGRVVAVDLRDGERVHGRLVSADKDTLSLWLAPVGADGGADGRACGAGRCGASAARLTWAKFELDELGVPWHYDDPQLRCACHRRAPRRTGAHRAAAPLRGASPAAASTA